MGFSISEQDNGQPIINPNVAPFVATLQAISNYAAKVGHLRVGTGAQRNATLDASLGTHWQDLDGGLFEWLWRGDALGWVPVSVTRGDRVAAATNGSGIITVNHGLPLTPKWVSIQNGGAGVLPRQREFTVTARSATQIQVLCLRTDTNVPEPFLSNQVEFYWSAGI